MIKQKGKNTQITNIKKGGGDITTDATATERIKREYCEQLYSNTIDILVEMKKKNHKRHRLPKLMKKEKIQIVP